MSDQREFVPFNIESACEKMQRGLAACLVFLVLAYLPAHADHIHHLWYNNSNWQNDDLTALTGGGIATPFGAIAAFRTTPNNQLHVYYVDASANHVHQLYFNGTNWSDSDLTSFTGGPQANPYGISGFAVGNLQYVFYVSLDLHVHELNYNNANWSDQDLTATVGGNLATPVLVAFVTPPNGQFHVYYQDASTLHEYQLYFNGTAWTYQDLTSVIGGAYCYADWIAGFAVGNQQHLFCAGYGRYTGNLDLLHIHYNNSSWVYEDVTFQSGGSDIPMYLGAGVAAFKVPGVNELDVWSVTDNTHFNRYQHLVNPAQWIDSDLTNSIGVPTDAQYGGITAFVTTPNNQYHVYYAPGSEVYQIFYNGQTWFIQDLTGGAGNADPTSGMAGFAIGNLQHVFYMSNN
ncbi:MAG TPA: hypothetical protein VKQ11_17640 [Candidatus Sulfotelmatobacter sp.]|nr:hypothetical protein [Candidatus Sulfotelmatobacter sp.]